MASIDLSGEKCLGLVHQDAERYDPYISKGMCKHMSEGNWWEKHDYNFSHFSCSLMGIYCLKKKQKHEQMKQCVLATWGALLVRNRICGPERRLCVQKAFPCTCIMGMPALSLHRQPTNCLICISATHTLFVSICGWSLSMYCLLTVAGCCTCTFVDAVSFHMHKH